MIDVRTGQPEPCPMCGSTDVRWRRRRWYDSVKNGSRFLIESVLSFIPGAKPGRPNRSHTVGTTEQMAILGMLEDLPSGSLRNPREMRLASATPDRFWRCRKCKRKGHVFNDSVAMLRETPRPS